MPTLPTEDGTPNWSFLTNHAQVLLSISRDPGIRLREIGETVGITERAAHRIVGELADAGYILREREGRRNHYTIRSHLPLHDRFARKQRLGDLLALLAGRADEDGTPGVEPEDVVRSQRRRSRVDSTGSAPAGASRR